MAKEGKRTGSPPLLAEVDAQGPFIAAEHLPVTIQDLFLAARVEEAGQRCRQRVGPVDLDVAHQVARQWIARLKSGELRQLCETQIEQDFTTQFLRMLGYFTRAQVSAGEVWTLQPKWSLPNAGIADAAIGRFETSRAGDLEATLEIVIELKGARVELDRRDPSSGRTPVQQAFDYLNASETAKWALVTNFVEFRLYHRDKGRNHVHRVLLEDLEIPDAFYRFYAVFHASSLLTRDWVLNAGELLRLTAEKQEEVGDELYDLYSEKRWELIQLLLARGDVADLDTAIVKSQMLLDRILFIAFAADRRLIDDQRILEKTAELRVPLRTAWNNFQSLFRALDVGDPRSGIPQFNGSMFAPDPVLDAPRFALGDQWATVFRTIGGYDFRSEVSVEVLGRVFERSIQDLEKLKQQGVPGPAPKDPPRKRPGRRKREGVFYTARPIVEYLVQSALEPPWTEVRQRAVERHRIARRDASPLAGGEQRPKTDRVKGQSRVVLSEARGRPTDEQSVHAITSVPSATCARELLDWLDSRTVCDPACGSGAFLIAAYDWFEERRMALLEDLASVEPEAPECSGGRETWRAATARQILRRNLYGVDLAPESVEIARLSLWIRSAIRNQTLTDLTHNIVQGNSVISDPAVDPRAFDWQVQFSEVFADGGFDAVIGNPPYVRQELLGSIKPRLQQEFPSVYNGLADLYVYFYDRGLQILKPGGMLAYVTTNKWMKAGYGEALRRTLARMHDLRRIVDFGHAKQFFPDADVFPCFAVVQKGVEEGDGEALIEDTLEPERSRLLDARNQAEAIDVGIIPRDLVRLDDLPAQIARSSFHIHRARLGSDAWSLERQEVHELLEKIRRSGAPLLEVTGAKPTRGILTGLNEAFLIDTTTRDRLVGKDSKCAPLIQAYLRGQDICRWLPDWAGLWMIALKSSGDHPWPWADLGDQAEACFRHTYPSLHEHLKPFEADLKRRQDQGRHWWELRACAYWELFTRPKIVYQEIQYHPAYAYDEESNLCNNKVFFLCTDYLVLLGILNSPAVWWHNWRYLPHMKDEALTPVAFLLESLLVPKLKRRFERLCGDICRHLLICSRDRRTTIRIVLDWLRTQHDVQKPSTRLQAATNLSSDEFVSEVKRSRGRERSMSAAALKDLRDEYARTIEPAKNLMAEALQLEYQLHDLVNEAYGLTPNEVKLMWDTAPPRMPIPRPPHV